MKITIKGFIDNIQVSVPTDKGSITRFTVRHLETDTKGELTGEETKYEVAAFNDKESMLEPFAKGVKVEVKAWLNSREINNEKFKGYNLSLSLSDIRLAAGSR